MKTTAFSNIAKTCCRNRRFRGAYCFHGQYDDFINEMDENYSCFLYHFYRFYQNTKLYTIHC